MNSKETGERGTAPKVPVTVAVPNSPSQRSGACRMNRNGFTLIELLVVVGIAGILFTLTTIEFRRNTVKTAIEGQVRLMNSDLTDARTKALFQKQNVAVRITSTNLRVYASADATGAPVITRTLRYPVSLSGVPDPIVFTTRGIIDSIDSGSVCIEPNINLGAFDSLVLSTTRIHTGKRNDGTACSPANVVVK